MEWPKLFRDARGMKVQTKYPLQNGFLVIPAGAVGRITYGHKWTAMEFTADPCTCCGVQARISRCDKYAFTPLEAAPEKVRP